VVNKEVVIMKINKKFGDSIDIFWVDACEVGGWLSKDEWMKVPEEVVCHTRGYFVGQNKEFVSVVHTIGAGEDNDVCGLIHIPIGNIKEIK